MSKIGVISDTHNCLREPVIELLQSCDAILHAGDFCDSNTFLQLKAIAPLYAVRGNADKSWAAGLPEFLSMELYGLNIFMVHNRKTIPRTEPLSAKNLIIYGHSHKYEKISADGQIWLNPGSCGRVRFHLPLTMAIIHTTGGAFQIQRVEFDIPSQPALYCPPENMRSVVHSVIKELDKGRHITAIAKKYRINEDLATQICRLYFTHPGVDTDGILKRMGLL